MRADTGEKVFFENMTEIGKTHGLTPVKICELLNGKRKTYKGWTAVEIREVKETVGSHVNMEEPKKKKIIPVKSVTFQNKDTGEIVNVVNLKEFSRITGLDYGNVKKLASGKVKSCKNYKLYDPLEAYKPSPEPK